MVVGGVEVCFDWVFYFGFCVVKVMLLKCNDDLVYVFWLFDQDCDGFIMGEGVGVFVLEDYEYVKVWGVEIFVELKGYGMIVDVYYVIVLLLDGEGGFCVM